MRRPTVIALAFAAVYFAWLMFVLGLIVNQQLTRDFVLATFVLLTVCVVGILTCTATLVQRDRAARQHDELGRRRERERPAATNGTTYSGTAVMRHRTTPRSRFDEGPELTVPIRAQRGGGWPNADEITGMTRGLLAQDQDTGGDYPPPYGASAT